MELYLSACSKTASVAANKAASSTVAEDSQQCGDVSVGPQGGVDVLASGSEGAIVGLAAVTSSPALVWL